MFTLVVIITYVESLIVAAPPLVNVVAKFTTVEAPAAVAAAIASRRLQLAFGVAPPCV
jgi:hypothetical protein